MQMIQPSVWICPKMVTPPNLIIEINCSAREAQELKEISLFNGVSTFYKYKPDKGLNFVYPKSWDKLDKTEQTLWNEVCTLSEKAFHALIDGHHVDEPEEIRDVLPRNTMVSLSISASADQIKEFLDSDVTKNYIPRIHRLFLEAVGNSQFKEEILK